MKTFLKGGVHPLENKNSKNSKIETIPLAEELIFPMNQHIGCPATPCVKVKDKVHKGDIIGKAAANCSSNIHSSVSGIVKSVTNDTVVITNSNTDEENFLDTKKELIEIIKDAGIVGLGGATFPTHVKLSPPKEFPINTIIINGAECEPYLSSDHRIMLEKGREIIDGIKLLLNLFPDAIAYIGIEANKIDAITFLNTLIKNEKKIKIEPLKTRYPQGGEKQLIQAIIKKEVPSGGFPFNIGVVVQNVATICAIYEAYYDKKPLYQRVVTIDGDLVKNPKNLMIPIGTPISHIIKSLNIDEDKIKKVILGGPMMGKTTSDLNTPVTKACSGILFFSDYTEKEERNCISCGFCVEKCPIGLIPSRLALFSKANKIDESIAYGINDCIECGSCAYTCPANIKIVQYLQVMKNEVRAELRKRSCKI